MIVGKAGFAVYLMKRRRWKLFGSELQEQSISCRGGVTWYKDNVVFPCRVNDKNLEEVHGYTYVYQLSQSWYFIITCTKS